jgi:DNA-binding response OmpR family regulator
MIPSGPILIVEDDPNIASLIERYMAREGFATVVAGDGAAALRHVRAKEKPAFVILDLMLPELDGREVCREIRKDSDIPILMLTARAEEVDKIVGFSLGADDYVVKPFSPRELVERVKAILRRAAGTPPAAGTVLHHGALVLEPDKRKVTLDGTPVRLTPSEYTLLHTLMAAPGRVFTRDELLGRLYTGGEVVVDRVVDVHIGKLRRKIEPGPSSPTYVHTVHGIGYRFADAGEHGQ